MELRKVTLLAILLAIAVSMVFVMGCGGGDDDDDDNDTTDDDDDTTPDDDDDNDTTPDDDDDDDMTWEGDQTVFVTIGDPAAVEVALNGLPAFMWTDPEDETEKPAVLVQDLVDVAAAKDELEDYKFNFIATDGFNILDKKLDGDYRGLPGYAELAQGWFIEYEEEGSKYTDIRIIWDEDLEYPTYMSPRMMDGGDIETVDNILFEEHVNVSVGYATTKDYTVVDLFGLPAFNSGGSVMAVYLHLIVLEAALEEFDPKTKDYAFNFISNDTSGNANLLTDELGSDLNLLPLWKDYDNDKDIHHGWIYDTTTDGYGFGWDAATGFGTEYEMVNMDDGYIDVFDVTPPAK